MNARLRRLVAVAVATGALCSAAAAGAVTGSAPVITNGDPLFDGPVTLTATVDPMGLDTSYYAECGPDTEYGSSTEPQVMPAGPESMSVQIAVGTMPYGAERHCRIVASNLVGTTLGDDLLVNVPTVQPLIGEISVTDIEGAPHILTSINPGGIGAQTKAWCGLTTDYGQIPDYQELAASGEWGNVDLSLYALSPGATYHCKVKAWNAHGITYSPDFTVEIAPTAPRVTMKDPVIGDTVKFTGKLDPSGSDTTTEISCVSGEDGHTGSFTKLAGTTEFGFALDLGTFHIGESYGCTVSAVNAIGTTLVEFPFKVSFRPPTAITRELSFADGQMSVYGKVVTGGLATTAVAECGTTEGSYPLVSASFAVPASDVTSMVSAKVSGVKHLTRYTCRIRATNDKGVSAALPLSLTTPPAIGPVEPLKSTVEQGYRVYLGATLAAKSYVTTTVSRRVAGRMSGATCKVAALSGERCVALVYVGKVKVVRSKGATMWAVPTVFGDRPLAAGLYNARVTTIDPATGKVTGIRVTVFRVTG